MSLFLLLYWLIINIENLLLVMIIYFAIILGIIAIVVFITSRQSIISVIGIGLFYIVEIIVSLLSLKHIFIDLNIHSLSEIIVTILLIGWIRWLIIEFKENFFAVIKDRKEK